MHLFNFKLFINVYTLKVRNYIIKFDIHMKIEMLLQVHLEYIKIYNYSKIQMNIECYANLLVHKLRQDSIGIACNEKFLRNSKR